MYSLVLMSAWATLPEAPGFHGFFRDLWARWSTAGCQGMSAAPRYGCEGGCRGRVFAGGCSGAAYSVGCYGTSYPAGCNGCQGEGLLARLRRIFDRSGCQGASYSAACYGCYGSFSYGCWGSAYPTGGYGSAALACYGSPSLQYTPTFNGGTSCQGGLIPLAPPPQFDTPGGAAPLPSVPPPTIPYAPPEAAPPPGSARGGPAISPSAGFPAVPTAMASAGQRGTVVVRLPADARLFAENRQLRQTGAERTFITPPLPPEREYTYRFRVEYERQGETVSISRLVKVRPGETVQVTFTDLTARNASEGEVRSLEHLAGSPPAPDKPRSPTPTRSEGTTATSTSGEKEPPAHSQPATSPHSDPSSQQQRSGPEPGKTASQPSGAPASSTTAHFGQPAAFSQPATSLSRNSTTASATLIVKLPAGATLFVNDQPLPSSPQTVRRFRTPPLPVGQEYAYLLRVEYVRNGQRESLTQKVPFRPGEQIELDLTHSGP
ncbi:TIGR03000 domain-containing protein [Thermogemmata fonticola]|uniref:TIGR03000 domain-containing protein n=1 Tax=Thermogemmata fonticola TaxID=2755323 RepID=A0A7V8VH45_9BACT|nr:TIGR03000 domain-containing protein [Thermogemmata fonticola]MBA2227785.1 TIGR03000 domain-containing protein [Thermogemmata fonticola]